MTRYSKGAQHERKVRDILEAKGFEVVRVAGSGGRGGDPDLLAWNDEQGFKIEVKAIQGFTRSRALRILDEMKPVTKAHMTPVVIWRNYSVYKGDGIYDAAPKDLRWLVESERLTELRSIAKGELVTDDIKGSLIGAVRAFIERHGKDNGDALYEGRKYKTRLVLSKERFFENALYAYEVSMGKDAKYLVFVEEQEPTSKNNYTCFVQPS
ncbi:MAG: hypothetical protein KGY80_14460 [Candidatus Thorarchaeota archaeon]|nr:hypothetical protein [Candidatus Thorarchaeota archaeon]